MNPTTVVRYEISNSEKAGYHHAFRAVYDFGVKDDKGRAVGAVCQFYTVEVKAERYLWNHEERRYMPPGVYFVGCFEAARASKQFGATQSRRVFTSVEAREAALADYLAAAKKRAEKKFA